jgi:hypothetical protein
MRYVAVSEPARQPNQRLAVDDRRVDEFLKFTPNRRDIARMFLIREAEYEAELEAAERQRDGVETDLEAQSERRAYWRARAEAAERTANTLKEAARVLEDCPIWLIPKSRVASEWLRDRAKALASLEPPQEAP